MEIDDTYLASCPFCGSRSVRMVEGIKGVNAYYLVVCEHCGAQTSFEYTSTKVGCLNAWNRRTL